MEEEKINITKDVREEITENISVTKDELKERKEKVVNFLSKKRDWIYYLILAFIVWISVNIRTRNIPKLKDITTGTWTLGPDLDPFLFLRWTEYIVEHGKLFVLDTMRSVPLADICSGITCNPVNTAGEMKLLSYMIAWFYHFLSFFSKEVTVTYAAILFPAIMFGLTIIAFFLFARKIFYKEDKKTRNIIALVATAFFAFIPSLLPRTIAGIPEKESAAFLFIFLSFYFILEAFTTKNFKKGAIFSVLAGISTGLLGLIWGGITFVFMTISGAVLFAFLLGQIQDKKFYYYSIWMFTSFLVMMPFSTRYSPINLIVSTSTGIAIGVFLIILIDFILRKQNKFNLKNKINLPEPIISLLISIILIFLIATILFGSSFIYDKILNIINQLIHPLDVGRFSLTVAENKQPYFINDWKNNFGPVLWKIPLYFWMFFIGAVTLFNNLIRKLRKEKRILLTFSYFIFLICLIFSRYSQSSILNGDSGLSLLVYFSGFLIFIGSFAYVYYKKYKEGEFLIFKEFNITYMLYFIILTMTIIGARGAIRLIMVLGAISPVVVSFLIIKTCKKYFKEKGESTKFFVGLIVLIILFAAMFTLWNYYKADKNTGENFGPGPYQWQWQKAMSWIRDNTSEDAVFAHWWDYGYWLQSIGERATILDGGNAITYWNHLMGRHVLTGDDETKALEFLYTHNGTHLLIDSTEIGKYTAFSSIGSDEDYDRFSWIQTYLMDEKQTQETSNETLYIYAGGSIVDEDIVWEEDGKEILLPKRGAVVGAIILGEDPTGKILQPKAVFIYNGNQYRIPLRFAYVKNTLYDFESGLDAGIFTFPKLNSLSNGKVDVNQIGAAFYLSGRVVHSQLANLYLFDENSDYFKIAHTESSMLVNELRAQNIDLGEFVYYNGFQGPIKIWEINYPLNIKVNPEYLETDYPNKELQLAKQGEY